MRTTMLLLLTAVFMSGVAFAQDSQRAAFVRCGNNKRVGLFAEPQFLKLVAKLKCGEKVTLIGDEEAGHFHVRTGNGEQGYVLNTHIAADAITASAKTYTVTLKVIETQQLPYQVQIGGGGVSTNCSINGSSRSFGDSISSHLSMSCSSYENPPLNWPHVLNAMLVEASDGNAYVIACDAAWRWSKCRALRAGDVFNARWEKDKLNVEYAGADSASKEAGYMILTTRPIQQAPTQVNESAPVVASTTSSCRITSQPASAEIRIDGDFVGQTPATIKLAAGKHRILISSSGYKEWTADLVVSAGSEQTINATLLAANPLP